MSFDWRTADEDGSWTEPARVEPPAPRRRRWPVALLILGAGLLAALAANRRVEQATRTAGEEAHASFSVLRQAAARGDRELLASVLPAQDSGWVALQRALLAQGLLFDRRALGLQVLPAEPRVSAIELAPDLATAEVVADFAYFIETGAGLTATVILQQTAVFRRGGQRWLLAPAGDNSWGGWVSQEGRRLTAVYPARDREIAGRLAFDLDSSLELMCATLVDLDCPPDLRLRLRFEKQAESLLALADEQAMLTSGREITLPAPTLAGRPVDEAGYQALYRGYAALVVSAATPTWLAGNAASSGFSTGRCWTAS